MSGVRIVPQRIETMKATAAVLMLRDDPRCGD
jgi:hypothetical protein